MTPTTTHKGFKITFSEVMETWDCREIGKSSKTLKGIKSQIDTYHRNMRSGASVDAFELSGIFRHQNLNQSTRVCELKPSKVVEYLGKDASRFSSGGIDVAVIPEGGSRRKVNLRSLYKATPANEEIVERAHQKGLEAVSAINQMNMILSELERLDQSDVDALSRLAGAAENVED